MSHGMMIFLCYVHVATSHLMPLKHPVPERHQSDQKMIFFNFRLCENFMRIGFVWKQLSLSKCDMKWKSFLLRLMIIFHDFCYLLKVASNSD